MDDSKGLAIAFEEAQQSYVEGGIPVRSLPMHPGAFTCCHPSLYSPLLVVG
jgi:hypothetical protein